MPLPVRQALYGWRGPLARRLLKAADKRGTKMKIAAIADLHCRVGSAGHIKSLLAGVEAEANVLALAGDLTDTGLPEEMIVLLEDLGQIDIPKLAVLGNHDHESGRSEVLAKMVAEQGIQLLDGTVVEFEGVGFAGVKGFCGGFDERMVQSFGEEALKTFVQAGIHEAVQLENALTKLETDRKVAILHYAPIRETVAGESPEIFPLMGSSRLANALDRHNTSVAFHGHAHHGSPFGRTAKGVPVHNVSRFVRRHLGEKPYLVLEI